MRQEGLPVPQRRAQALAVLQPGNIGEGSRSG
jgi:hypothetical protein